MSAPLPDNESARLEVLHNYQILDTSPEEAFDDLTYLAAQICGVPIALVSLIDANRQWFKSKVGLEVSETCREAAFCGYTILQNHVLLVPDTLTDERFATNPLVTGEPGIRFYAGTPLTTSEGYSVGTLCVIDRVPRKLSQEQLRALQALGRQVLSQMELRRNLLQLSDTTAQLQQAIDFESRLKRITDKVRDSLDENQILQVAVQELATGLSVNCNATLYDPGAKTSVVRHECASSKIPEGYVAQIENFPELRSQLQQGRSFQFCSIESHPLQEQATILVSLIAVDQEVLGDLWLVTDKHKTFEDLELRLVQQVINQCAIAIRQARLYQAAQAQVQALEKLHQLKDDFLSTVSHELRTPVSNMKLAIHMLGIASTDAQKQRYLDILRTECTREIELINDLLDLQRLEAGAYPTPAWEAIVLQDWLPAILESFHVRAQECQQNLQVHLPPNLPLLISDNAVLERVLAELLNNACKYTKDGKQINFKVNYIANFSVNALVATPLIIFSISNEAEIPVAEVPRLFEKFYRSPSSQSQRQRGTGLGLALVQKFIEQLQGTIEANSEDGWITFTIRLPVQPDEYFYKVD